MSPIFSLCIGSAVFVLLLIAGTLAWGLPFVAGVVLAGSAVGGSVVWVFQEVSRP